MIVYKATHKKTGRIYVGATTKSLKSRQKEHAHKGNRKRIYFAKAVHKEGIRAFTWSVLWHGENKDILYRKEREFIVKLKCRWPTGYNLSSGGMRGARHHWISKQQVSTSKYGQKHSVPGWAKGLTKFTDPRIMRRSELLRGIPKSKEHRRKLSIAKTGKPAPWIIESNKRRSGPLSEKSKRYILTHPDGREEFLIGIAQFCREHGLNHAALGAVALGRRTHHKNYKLRFA